jgi:hypothetical protein
MLTRTLGPRQLADAPTLVVGELQRDLEEVQLPRPVYGLPAARHVELAVEALQVRLDGLIETNICSAISALLSIVGRCSSTVSSRSVSGSVSTPSG